jgi:hypothetical protein
MIVPIGIVCQLERHRAAPLFASLPPLPLRKFPFFFALPVVVVASSDNSFDYLLQLFSTAAAKVEHMIGLPYRFRNMRLL